MNLKQYLPESSTAYLFLAILLFALWYSMQPRQSEHNTAEIGTAEFSAQEQIQLLDRSAVDVETQIQRLQLYDDQLDRQIRALIENNQFKLARTRLLELAAQAVEAKNEQQLADILLLLGSLSIDEQELNAAELILQEVLDIAIRQNDTITMARSYQQLGRLNIKARALARYAAEAYDQLWLARRQIYQGNYRHSQENLQQVIEANLDIRRFGAAASAYETLADFHRHFSDSYLAQQADIEAARLYANSGQLERSRRVLNRLKSMGLQADQQLDLSTEITALFGQYQTDARQNAESRDMQMLYHHYLDKGDHQRAWQLRIKASQALDKTGERSVFERQADVLAILYSSNFAMDRARHYLHQAGELFAEFDAQKQLADTVEMQSLIY